MRNPVISTLLVALFCVTPLCLRGQTPDAAGVYRVGDGVSAPVALFQPEPEFSEQERKLKVSPQCTLSLVVDTDGHVRDVRMIHSVAESQPAEHREAAQAMDAKIVAAVSQYRFKPAMFGGKPVPVAINIGVNFTIF